VQAGIALDVTPTPLPVDVPAWIRLSGLDTDRLVVGFSRGGELALLLGATFPEIKAVVSYVGSGIVVSSLDSATSAWLLRGESVPYWTYTDVANLDAATFAVERINGPVLLIPGQRDLL